MPNLQVIALLTTMHCLSIRRWQSSLYAHTSQSMSILISWSVQAMMPQAELQETLQAYPMFSYVVDFNGDVVAALTSWPLEVPDLALERHACALCLDTCLSMLENLSL